MGRRFASSPEMGSPVSGFSGPLYGVGSGSGVDVGPGRGVSPSEGARIRHRTGAQEEQYGEARGQQTVAFHKLPPKGVFFILPPRLPAVNPRRGLQKFTLVPFAFFRYNSKMSL